MLCPWCRVGGAQQPWPECVCPLSCGHSALERLACRPGSPAVPARGLIRCVEDTAPTRAFPGGLLPSHMAGGARTFCCASCCGEDGNGPVCSLTGVVSLPPRPPAGLHTNRPLSHQKVSLSMKAGALAGGVILWRRTVPSCLWTAAASRLARQNGTCHGLLTLGWRQPCGLCFGRTSHL